MKPTTFIMMRFETSTEHFTQEPESVERANFYEKVEGGLYALQAERIPEALSLFMQARKMAESMQEGGARVECLETITGLEKEFGRKEEFDNASV